tara:strand:- start:7119 stop:8036 length:918 start_codon:yes stop_codon:yes gene_type:complete
LKKLPILLIGIILLSNVFGCSVEERLFSATQFIDENDQPYGIEQNDNRPVVVTPDYMLMVAAGEIPGKSNVNKSGRNIKIDAGVTADIWDGGHTGNISLIWVAPTAPRVHDIASSHPSDTAAGPGARTIRIAGLRTWATPEVTETHTLNGRTNVATGKFVIIHHMEVITKGGTAVNVGAITATARTDNTVTAMIQPAEGQTHMAIIGIPSGESAYATSMHASILSANTTGAADIRMLFNPEPDTELVNFITRQTAGLIAGGSSNVQHQYNPFKMAAGPAIIKAQATSSANDNDISAGFELIIANN